jgi:hypothetical protein
MIMKCVQHSSSTRRKSHRLDAPYCRNPDWWKETEQKSEERRIGEYTINKSDYTIQPIKKSWSIILFDSDSQAFTRRRRKELEERFHNLVKQWKEETFFISSTSQLLNHPAYRKIISLGRMAAYLVLRELQNDTGRWFHALRYMTGEDVSEGMKDYESAKAAWLKWGRDNKLI